MSAKAAYNKPDQQITLTVLTNMIGTDDDKGDQMAF